MRLLRAAIYSNIFVAAVLGALTACTYAVFDYLEFRWHVVAAIFLGSLLLYTFHRLYRTEHLPTEYRGERHEWILRHARPAKITMGLCIFLLMMLLPNFHADAIVWLTPAGIISIGYTIPLVPGENNWWRIRDIPFSKPLVISLVATYLTLAFPLFEQQGIGSVFEPGTLRAFSERLLFILAVTIPFEMRDMNNDKKAGLETVATEFGYIASKRLTWVVAFAWLLLALWRAFEQDLSWPFIAGPFVLLCPLMIGISLLSAERGDLFYTLVFEGMIALYAVVTTGAFILH